MSGAVQTAFRAGWLTPSQLALIERIMLPGGGVVAFGQVRRHGSSKGRWRVDCRPHGWIFRDLKGSPFCRKADAVAALGYVRTLIDQGFPHARAVARARGQETPKAQVVPVYDAWVEAQWARVLQGDLARRTAREYERYGRKGGEVEWWADQLMLDVTAQSVEKWLAWMHKRKLGSKTRQNILGAFRTCYRWHRRDDAELQEPVWPTVKQTEHITEVLTTEQQDAVLTAIPWEERGAHLIAAHMGIRPGEVRALSIGDYRPGDPPMLVVERAMQGMSPSSPIGPTKTRTARVAPCTEGVQAWVEAIWPSRCRIRANVGEALCVNPRTGNRWSHWALRESWLRGCKAAGVSIGLYAGTKHSAATAMLEASGDLELVRKFLGHADSKSTRRYATVRGGRLVELVRKR